MAREAGLNLLDTMSMSVLVIAGASQFTALALLQDQAPLSIALLTALVVNLRMAMYSAALVPHLGHVPFYQRAVMAYLMVDQAFAVAVRRYVDPPPMTPAQKVSYYFFCKLLICPFWYLFTFLGAWIGSAIAREYSLDFAVPLCFAALTAPLLRSASHIIAALCWGGASVLFAWVPWLLGLIVTALIAIVVGAQSELYFRRRAKEWAHDSSI